MKITRAYKTELDLNNQQRTACLKHAGAARFAYNWGLGKKIEAYKLGEKSPSAIDLHREINRLKRGELSWLYEVSKCAPQEALRNLDKAYANFFRRVKTQKGKKPGFPRFKNKKVGVGNFRLTGAIRIEERVIQLPRLGKLRLKEVGYIPTSGIHVLSATVSEKAGRWYVSVQAEVEILDLSPKTNAVCGVDLGITMLATISDGTVFENPKALKRSLTKIKRLQRVVSRRKKGSANRKKAVHKLAMAHQKVANIRNHSIHQVTSYLAKTKSVVVLENLNVSGMLKNHRLAQSISDVGMYEFRRQLQYKAGWYGCELRFADRFFPSSKTCSRCGTVVAELSLSQRTFHCDTCGLEIDRDLNAAINLSKLFFTTASSAGSHACGEDVRPAYSQADFAEAGTKPQTTPVRMFV